MSAKLRVEKKGDLDDYEKPYMLSAVKTKIDPPM